MLRNIDIVVEITVLKIYVKFIAVALFLLYQFPSFAACSVGVEGHYVAMTLNFGTVIVQRDAPVGSILSSATSTTIPQPMMGCDVPWAFQWLPGIFSQPANLTDVFQTNIPGIGITIPGVTFAGQPPNQRAANGYSVIANGKQFNLIKTAPVTGSGELTAGQVLVAKIVSPEVLTATEVDLMPGSRIIVPGCIITTPALSFPIGSVNQADFGNTVGFVHPNTNTQDLGLDCDAGVNINVKLNGLQNPDTSSTNVLALSNQGAADVASGLGVQLLYNGSPLTLNSNVVLKTTEGGQETFPIIARYIQTKTQVTVGSANAAATLQITYQ